jgi:citrate synthase
MLAVYGFHAYNHYEHDESMYIHRPDPKLSAAENFLMMLRPDKKYTQLEAKVLDVALMLHMEHGGGNNSTFTTHVVTSSGTAKLLNKYNIGRGDLYAKTNRGN